MCSYIRAYRARQPLQCSLVQFCSAALSNRSHDFLVQSPSLWDNSVASLDVITGAALGDLVEWSGVNSVFELTQIGLCIRTGLNLLAMYLFMCVLQILTAAVGYSRHVRQ